MIKDSTLHHDQPLLSMIKNLRWIALFLILGLQTVLYAQVAEPTLAQAFTTAISQGDMNGLTALLGDEVELMQPGASGTFRKSVVSGKIAEFLRHNPPVRFMLKHQGSSADGQMYAIGQLTTQSGNHYKVLLRAKPEGAQYRIFKLDLQNL